MDFENLTEKELLSAYCRIVTLLKERGITNKNNIVGGYGEHLASKYYNFEIEKNVNNKGFDGMDKKNNIKYQVKTMWSSEKKSFYTVFNGFKIGKHYHFDYAICISLDDQFNIDLMVKIPYNLIKKYVNSRGGLTLSLELVKEPHFELHPKTKPKVRAWLLDE